MADRPDHPSDPAGRPDLDVLADYAAGLLDPSQAAEVEKQLAADPALAATVEALRDLPALLADTPVEPMPDDVSARLDAVLQQESHDRSRALAVLAEGPPPVPPPAHAPVVDLAARRRRWVGPTLAAAAVLTVAGIGVGAMLDRDPQSAESAGESPASEADSDASAGDDSAQQDDGPGAAGIPAPNHEALPAEPEALAFSSRRFGQEVDALVEAEAVPRTFGSEPSRVAPLCAGTAEEAFPTAVSYDGRPAYLLLFGSVDDSLDDRAVVFACRGDRAVILDRTLVDSDR